MTKRITTAQAHYWKVRIVLPGALLHVASGSEPKLGLDNTGRIDHVSANWLHDPERGDTVGHIDWSQVIAVTWRWTGQ